MLRGKKPESVQKRLKMFMFGPSGVGKTTAALNFPNSYIIDGERGTENYDKIIAESGSVVFHTTDIQETIAEVKSLLSEKHDFRTLVIDPITPMFNDLLDKCEEEVGSAHGRHYGAANKVMKRLANLIMNLDMNVILTAHAKDVYGQNMTKLGNTFDGWKGLDYWFDLLIEIRRMGEGAMVQRTAVVRKTRINTFPDGATFEWSYDAFKQRYDVTTLERAAKTVTLATPEQIKEIRNLLNMVRLPAGTVEAWFGKAQVSEFADMPSDILGKCIEWARTKAPANTNGNGMAELAARF